MKWKREYNKIKTCPRCGLQYMEGLVSCPDCGLIFSRLKVATNSDAKKKIKLFDFDYIIKTNVLPSDVSFVRLLIYSIFFGCFGGHCFYVGRYFRGGLLLFNFLIVLFLAIFNSFFASIGNGALLGTLSTICGFVLLVWLWDILMIATKRFKVPVAIDLESDRTILEEEQARRDQFFKDVDELTNQKDDNLKVDENKPHEDDNQNDTDQTKPENKDESITREANVNNESVDDKKES